MYMPKTYSQYSESNNGESGSRKEVQRFEPIMKNPLIHNYSSVKHKFVNGVNKCISKVGGQVA